MRINNVPHMRTIEAVHSLKTVNKIKNLKDFEYELERNGFNNQLYLYSMKLKSKNNNTNELNHKRNIDKQRLSSYGSLIFKAQSRKQLEDFKKPSYDTIQNLLRRCKAEILGFNPQSFLINASCLISPMAVMALLNFKDEDA